MNQKLEHHREVIQSYLNGLRTAQQRLPGISGRVNCRAVARAAGLGANTFVTHPELRQLLETAAAQLGIVDLGRTHQLRPASEPPRYRIPTYGELKQEGPQLLGVAEASIPSYLSALNSWMGAFDLTDSDTASGHFGTMFPLNFAFFKTDRTDSVISRIKRWAEVYDLLIKQNIILPSNFSDALHSLMRTMGKSSNAVSEKIGVSHSMIDNWINNSMYPTNISYVKKLEEALEVLPGTLTRLYAPLKSIRLERFRKVPEQWWPEGWRNKLSLSNTPYLNKRQLVLRLIPEYAFSSSVQDLRKEFDQALDYIFSGQHSILIRHKVPLLGSKKYNHHYTEWNAALKKEWNQLSVYKTSEDNFSNQDRTNKWKESSQKLATEQLQYFFGHLILDAKNDDLMMRGKGFHPETLTLAHLTFQEYVESYLEFKRFRVGGFNSFTSWFINLVASFLRPVSGWIWQHPELLMRLSDDEQRFVQEQGGWHAHCEKSRAALLKNLKSLEKKKVIVRLRDSFRPILPLLNHQYPIKFVVNALKIHRQTLEVVELTSKNITQELALGWRTHLLISLLIRIPLRAKHWGLMTYRADNTGTLRRSLRGWELVIPYTEFKNFANAKIFERRGDGLLKLDFSATENKLLAQLSDPITLYIERYRPLIAGDSDALFPHMGGGRLTTQTVGVAVSGWTKEYLSQESSRGCGIPGVLPFSTHAFRDIVATHLIKNGSPDQAAAALLDDRETVEEHYARFLPSDRLADAFGAMMHSFLDQDDDQ